jgi:hypothetical protein
VDYSTDLLSGWATFTNIIISPTGTFSFISTESGGLPAQGFYRVRTAQ